MYANGESVGARDRKKWRKTIWRYDDAKDRNVTNGKGFVQCICPKCTERHNVYMLWTGRGVPRKYCANCKPLVSGYDEAAIYEAAVYAPRHSKKKGRRHEGD
jgi:hypothetical protein